MWRSCRSSAICRRRTRSGCSARWTRCARSPKRATRTSSASASPSSRATSSASSWTIATRATWRSGSSGSGRWATASSSRRHRCSGGSRSSSPASTSSTRCTSSTATSSHRVSASRRRPATLARASEASAHPSSLPAAAARARRPLPPPGQRAQDRRPRAVEADPGGHRRRAEAHAVRLSRVPRARGAHVPGVRRQGRHLGGGLHAVRGDDAPPRLHRRRHGGDPRQSRLRGARAPLPPARHREAAADPAAPPPPPQQHGPIFGDWTAELEELLLAMLRMRTKERPTARELLTSAHLAPAVATIDPQALAHVVRAAPPPPPPTRRVVVARRVG